MLAVAMPAAAAPPCRLLPDPLGPVAVAPAGAASILPNSLARRQAGQPWRILAFGSSSTSGVGASSPAAAFPARLAVWLAALAPGRPVSVDNRGVAGDTLADMLARLGRDALAPPADLVLWQLGSNEALQGLPTAGFAAAAAAAIVRLRAAGRDVLLIEPQWLADPALSRASAAMAGLVRRIGFEQDVPVLRRFDLMRHWRDAGGWPPAAMLVPDGIHMTDDGYDCLARQLAEALLARLE